MREYFDIGLGLCPYREICVRELTLSQGLKALVSNEDYKKARKRKWCAQRSSRGSLTYAVSDKGGRRISLHRFLTDSYYTDHIDGNGLDNTRSNLRLGTCSDNLHNSKRHRDGMTGIQFHKEKKRRPYSVSITVRGYYHWVGSFKNLKAAQDARANAIKKYLNPPSAFRQAAPPDASAGSLATSGYLASVVGFPLLASLQRYLSSGSSCE